MKTKNLAYYKYVFTHLRRDPKNGGAPHKPILLLSLIDAFEQGIYSNNQIFITPELISSFKVNWSQYVKTEHHISFALPFYHLHTEPFWKLIPKIGCELWVQSKGAMRSLTNLETAVEYALLDEVLFDLLQTKENAMILRYSILETYFPNTVIINLVDKSHQMLETIRQQMIQDNDILYLKRIECLKAQLDKETFEEEMVLRSSIFKREVPKIYTFTCCISELRVETTFNNTHLIEACHIEPFSVAYNDTLKNGIVLTPTLHKAFDKGLITIDDNYKVIVSNRFAESKSPQGLKQYHGKELLLPQNPLYYPCLKNLSWHRKNVFENGDKRSLHPKT